MQFRIGSIPVSIAPGFWLFLLFFTGLYRQFSFEGLILSLVVFISLLFHEYGHAATASHFGSETEIVLEALGGSALYREGRLSPKHRFYITLNGPLFTALLIITSHFLLQSTLFQGSYYFSYFLFSLRKINILWLFLNLIPIAPLDGGKLLGYLLENYLGERGRTWTWGIGFTSACFFVPYLLWNGFLFFAVLVAIFGFQNGQLFFRKWERGSGQGEFFLYQKGLQAFQEDDRKKAKKLLQKLVKLSSSKAPIAAVETLAKIYVKEKEEKKAYDLLLQGDPSRLQEGKPLLCKLAFLHKDYSIIEQFGKEGYEREPSYEMALLNSHAFAQIKKGHLAGGWLYTASLFGEEFRKEATKAVQDPIYDSVRDQEEFQSHLSKIL